MKSLELQYSFPQTSHNQYPYGKVLREFNEATDARYLTTHHERDKETGFDYRGARFYDSDLGRFLSLDPHAMDYPSLSDYSYVADNPIIFIDPDGKDIIAANSTSLNNLTNAMTNIFANRTIATTMFDVGAGSSRGAQVTGKITVTATQDRALGKSAQNLTQREFTRWMRNTGRDNNVNFSRAQLDAGYNFYLKAKSGNNVEVLTLNSGTLVDNGTADMSTGNQTDEVLSVNDPSNLSVVRQFRQIEDSNRSMDPNTMQLTHTQNDLNQISTQKQQYLNTITNNTGVRTNNNSILIDTGTAPANSLVNALTSP